MTTLLWLAVAFVVIVAPTWIAVCLWHSRQPRRPVRDPRITIAENYIERSSRLGNAEFRASLIDRAGALYEAIALDSKSASVAKMYKRTSVDCEAKSYAIREYAMKHPPHAPVTN